MKKFVSLMVSLSVCLSLLNLIVIPVNAETIYYKYNKMNPDGTRKWGATGLKTGVTYREVVNLINGLRDIEYGDNGYNIPKAPEIIEVGDWVIIDTKDVKRMDKVLVGGQKDHATLGRVYPYLYRLERSDDGTNFTSVPINIVRDDPNYDVYLVPTDGYFEARFIKIYFDEIPPLTSTKIGEIDILTSSDPSEGAAWEALASKPAKVAGRTVNKVLDRVIRSDGAYTEENFNAAAVVDDWIQVYMHSMNRISRVKVWGQNRATRTSPNNYELYYTDENSVLVKADVTIVPDPNNIYDYTLVLNQPVYTRTMRLVIKEAPPAGEIRIAEITLNDVLKKSMTFQCDANNDTVGNVNDANTTTTWNYPANHELLLNIKDYYNINSIDVSHVEAAGSITANVSADNYTWTPTTVNLSPDGNTSIAIANAPGAKFLKLTSPNNLTIKEVDIKGTYIDYDFPSFASINPIWAPTVGRLSKSGATITPSSTYSGTSGPATVDSYYSGATWRQGSTEKVGDSFKIKLAGVQLLSAINMYCYGPYNVPGKFDVFVGDSNDANYVLVAHDVTGNVRSYPNRAKDTNVFVNFDRPVRGQYINIVLTQADPAKVWWMYEVDTYTPFVWGASKFTDSNDVTIQNIQNGINRFKQDIQFSGSEVQSGCLIAGLYKKSTNQMIKCTMQPFYALRFNRTISVDLDVDSSITDLSDYQIRVFNWYGLNNIKPLSSTVSTLN